MKDFNRQVKDWASKKPADEEYKFTDVRGCALSCFLKENGYPVFVVGAYCWIDLRSENHPISKELTDALVRLPHTYGALAARLPA